VGDRRRNTIRWSLLATLLVAVMVPASVLSDGAPLVAITSPGAEGPAAAACASDFPELALPPGKGHDGQQFYAIARDPLRPEAAAPYLDRPRYRLQRIAYPLVAGVLSGARGGTGLVLAMLATGLAAIFAGCLATGALATRWGAPPWSAAMFAVVPGNLVALRLSTADAMALALAVSAIALLEARRPLLALALVAGSVAVLTKEAVLVVLLAYALARRDRRSLLVAAVPFATGAAWALWLRLTVVADRPQVIELTAPFAGLAAAARRWARGEEAGAPLILAATVMLVAAALWRHRDRLIWSLAGVPALFVIVLSADATGLWANVSRIAAPALLFALVAVVSPASLPRNSELNTNLVGADT